MKNGFKLMGLLTVGFAFACCLGCVEKKETVPVETETATTVAVVEKQVYEYTKEDFNAQYDAYVANGDQKAARETLIEMHRWYPAEENIARISEAVIVADASDSAVLTLLDSLCSAIEQDLHEEAIGILTTSEWQDTMQEDLVGVTRKTKVTCETYMAQIRSDVYCTELMVLKKDGTFLYFLHNQMTTILGQMQYENSAYNGPYRIAFWDDKGEPVKVCSGTFKNNVSVGDFTTIYEGVTFVGSLSENGTTLEEQKKDMREANQVIYAFDASKKKYLYEENCSLDSFVVDSSYLKLPQFVEW